MNLNRCLVVAATGLALFATSCSANPSDDPSADPTGPQLYSSYESQRLVAQCLKDKGWDATFDPNDGSYEVEIPRGADEKFESDEQSCEAAYPADTREFDELSEKEQRQLYDSEMKWRECVIGEGYDIERLPSFEVYREQVSAGTLEPAQLPQGSYAEVMSKCPVQR